jgi:hypothetical protein
MQEERELLLKIDYSSSSGVAIKLPPSPRILHVKSMRLI